MRFTLTAQPEIAYLKDKEGRMVRKYFAPRKTLFQPVCEEYEEFPNVKLVTLTMEEFKFFFLENH